MTNVQLLLHSITLGSPSQPYEAGAGQ